MLKHGCYAWVAGFLLLLAGCSYTAESRLKMASELSQKASWQHQAFYDKNLSLEIFLPQMPVKSDLVNIFIEGDGLAWLSKSTPSQNPTPVDPIALKLALNTGGASAYIGRPCQYNNSARECANNKWWTSHRFAPEVIQITNAAIDKIKAAYGAKNVVLVGYSGGGAVAALVASKRDDVEKLITLAGNLDTDKWVEIHGIKPLSGSLNPADKWQNLQNILQTHYVGADDKVIPRAVAESYVAKFPSDKKPEIRLVQGYSHQCCWADMKGF
jgi:hypothetical protein